jgi:hypothetical protein
MSSSPITAVIDELAGQIPDRASSPGSVTDSEWTGLCEALALVPDPRRRRGVRYPFAVLTIVVCAMLSGARSPQRPGRAHHHRPWPRPSTVAIEAP